MTSGDTQSWDTQWLLAINQSFASNWGDLLFPWLSSVGGFSIPLLGLLCLWLSLRNKSHGWKLALLLIGVIISADLLGNLLKLLFSQARPCGSLAEVMRSVQYSHFQACPGNSSGMPSNHAMNFFTLAGLLLFWFRAHPVSISVFLIACMVGLSRIYLGKHFPSQVFAGAAFGFFYGWLIAKICDQHLIFANRHKLLNPND